jgi:hypothetical protein
MQKLLLSVVFFTILTGGALLTSSTPCAGNAFEPFTEKYYDQVFSTNRMFLGNFSMELPISPQNITSHTWHLNMTLDDYPTNYEFLSYTENAANIANINASGSITFNTTVYFNGQRSIYECDSYVFTWTVVYNWTTFTSFRSSVSDPMVFSSLHKGENNITVNARLQADFVGNITYGYGGGGSQTDFFHNGLGYYAATLGPYSLFVGYVPLISRIIPYLLGSAMVGFASIVAALFIFEKRRGRRL